MIKNRQSDGTDASCLPSRRRRRRNTADITRAADGLPGSRRGRKPRRPEPASAAQAARQTRAFDLHVEGLSACEIAKALGINRGTVALDVQMEFRRRAVEVGDKREAAIAASIAQYEHLIFRATQRLAEINAARQTSKGALSAGREARECDRLVLEAQARIDLVLGLVATRWDEVPNATPYQPRPGTSHLISPHFNV